VKRLVDLAAGGLGLLLLSPVFAVIAILIKLDSPGPVFFRQVRVGRNGLEFRIHKFRTMFAAGSDHTPQLTVKGDARITRVGRTLRRYKLDELPQLIDVLLGDMSLVGPRPEVPRYVEKWDDTTRTILLSVRPGMTDLASVEFRHENEMLDSSADPEHKYVHEIAPVKNRLGVYYVENRSIWLDLKILSKTVVAILR
jgi:lipopolysaccharide/colanic/teichoic acid biosynthesis glycosyltransferase